MKVSVVIPNFNGSQLLKAHLPKILSAVGDAEVIVADDASTDDSVLVLKKYFPKVKIIAREKNEGFASAVNDGAKIASGELLLLLNSDVVPQRDFLKYLTVHFSDPAVFAVGCLQRTDTSEGIRQEGRGAGHFGRGFLIHKAGQLDRTDTLWVFGGAGMFRKELWDKLGGLDTIYNPFYWEDIDLSYRALKGGFKLVFEPKSVVVHHQAEGAIRSLYKPAQIKTIAYRNQILFVWLNITDFDLMGQHLIYLPYHMLSSLVRFDFAFLKGFLLAKLKFFQAVSHRTRNKKLNVISDKQILSSLAG